MDLRKGTVIKPQLQKLSRRHEMECDHNTTWKVLCHVLPYPGRQRLPPFVAGVSVMAAGSLCSFPWHNTTQKLEDMLYPSV